MVGLKGKTIISLNINGDSHEVMVRPSDLLLDVSREQLGLTSTKAGCKNGDHGACTVMVGGWPVKSCLMPAVKARDRKIITVERPGDKAAVQKAFIETSALQCGYRTSGFLMVRRALITQHPIMSGEVVIEEWLQSDLYRYISYQEIREAVHLMHDFLQGADI